MMRRGKIVLSAVAAALLLAAGLAWWFLGRTPPIPPHPLSLVTSASVVAVTADGEAIPKDSSAFRDAAALPSRLATITPADAQPVNWAAARQMRLATADGLILWLQLVEEAGRRWVRVNADPLPGAALETRQQARAIKRLRLRAYRLDPPASKPHE